MIAHELRTAASRADSSRALLMLDESLARRLRIIAGHAADGHQPFRARCCITT